MLFLTCQSGQVSIKFKSLHQAQPDGEDSCDLQIEENIKNHSAIDSSAIANNCDRRYELTIGDNGVGIPGNQLAETTSMGLRLVRILGRQLEAESRA
jgi:two-component sensor histidine kinase